MTFNNHRSYLKAVSAAFVEIKTTKFTKKVSGFGALRGAWASYSPGQACDWSWGFPGREPSCWGLGGVRV